MNAYSLAHLEDAVLVTRLTALVACDRKTTAQLLAHLAEVEARQLHLRAGYDSMKAYCVGELRFSEDGARRRVHAARVARNYPSLFEAVADGRVHLTAISLIASRLTPENVDDLVDAVTHKKTAEIEFELAKRYPQAEALRLDGGLSPQVVVPQEANAVGRVLKRVQTPSFAPARIAPITADRYAFEISIDAETHEMLRRVQDLLGHAVPSNDLGQVLNRALSLALVQLEKRKFAKVVRPRQPKAASRARTIPAHVRLAVYKRDGGRCAFVGENGHRCGSTVRLEFDHIVPVAQGGQSTAANVRLLCRVHNQFAAEQAFSPQFMEEKRRRSELREDIAAGLRSLGMKVTDARRAAEQVDLAETKTVEEGLRRALKMLRPPRSEAPQPPPQSGTLLRPAHTPMEAAV